jgi:hypothetical protein
MVRLLTAGLALLCAGCGMRDARDSADLVLTGGVVWTGVPGAVGKPGDVVVISDNLLTMEATRIPSARVDYTIIDGRIVHERQRQAGDGR